VLPDGKKGTEEKRTTKKRMHFSVVPVPSRLQGGEVSDAEERGKEAIRR